MILYKNWLSHLPHVDSAFFSYRVPSQLESINFKHPDAYRQAQPFVL